MADGLSGETGREMSGPDEGVYAENWTPPPSRDRLWLHLVLFLATVYTTTAAGTEMALSRMAALSPESLPPGMGLGTALLSPKYLVLGLPFSLTLLTILGIHEMGHYLASRWWRVRATLPYFIPFPSLIGTMGAVIRIKSRIPNRRALIDIGAAGPLAGFVVAVAALGVGLHLSAVVPRSLMGNGSLTFGDSLLSSWMSTLIVGPLPTGYDVYIHPIGFAGWLGLFVTVLNLLPIGQFDGGHIVYAVFGRWHEWVSKGTILGLALFWALGPPYGWIHASRMLSVWLDSRWTGWLIWLFLAVLLGRRHPPTSDPYTELDPVRKVVGYLALLIFLLCFIPRPISFSSP